MTRGDELMYFNQHDARGFTRRYGSHLEKKNNKEKKESDKR